MKEFKAGQASNLLTPRTIANESSFLRPPIAYCPLPDARLIHRWVVLALIGFAAIVTACGGGGGGGGGGGATPTTNQTLTVDKNGGGSGTVTSSPSGVQCGATCAGAFPQGSTVTLNASANAGSVFSGWGNVCPGTTQCTVTLNADMTVPANFSSSQNFTLTVNKNGNGTVNSTTPVGIIQCGATCVASVAPNTQVTLTATPDPGNSFLGWGGPCSGTGDCTVTVSGVVVVPANFTGAGAFDFSLAPTPPSQLVFAGSNTSFTIAATLLTAPGSAQPVTFDVQSGCPVNATCTFTPNPVTPTQSGALTTLVVTTASNTALGPASLVVRGIGAGVTRTTGVQLRVVKVGASATQPRFAYVVDSDDDTLSIYTVSANPGELRHRGYVKTGSGPDSVATTPDGKFVYVSNNDVGTISSFAVTQPPAPNAGNLTSIGSAVSSGKLTNALLVHSTYPAQNFLYAVNFATSTTISNGSVSVFSINTSTGVLTNVPCAQCQSGQSSTGIAIDPAGKFAYVGNYVSNPLQQPPISAYQIQANGTLVPITLGTLYPDPSAALAVDPTGKFLFVVDDIFDKILVYTINSTTGALTQAQSVSTADSPGGLAVDPSGKYLYVSNGGADKVSGYAINSVTGALTAVPNSPFAAGTGPSSVTVDPSGNFVYVTNLSANTVSVYFLDQGTGELFSLGLSRTRPAPQAMAISKGATALTYLPKFAYATNQGSNSVSQYSINNGTGALTPLAPATVSVSPGPVSLATPLVWNFLYVVNSGNPNQLAGFLINQVTGLLSGVPNSPVGAGPSPQDVAVEPSSRFLYVVNQGSNSVLPYRINADGSTTSLVLAGATGTSPVAATADPTGQYVFVANQVSNNVSGFTIDSGAGTLSPIALSPTAVGNTPQSVVVDESGQFLYVVNAGSPGGSPPVIGSVSAFKIKAGGGQDGQLTTVGTFPTGQRPATLATDPAGKWLLATNSADGTLSVYRINQATGSLTLVAAPTIVGVTPDGVTIDPSGKFVYVTTFGTLPPPPGPGVVAFPFDSGTGLLGAPVAGSPFAVGSQPTAIKTTGTIQ